MLTLNSYCSTFSEPFSVLLPKPESFQLFPQCFEIGISSGLWVEISSGPGYCCPVPPRASERAAAVFARAADRPPQSRASAATSVGVYTDGSRWRGAGAWKKTEAMGGFVALPADFPPAKSISPSVSLGEAGERCGKKLPGGQISATALVTGFPDHFTCFPFITRSHAWDMEKPPQKTCSE